MVEVAKIIKLSIIGLQKPMYLFLSQYIIVISIGYNIKIAFMMSDVTGNAFRSRYINYEEFNKF